MVNAAGRSPFLIVCDHAGRATPARLHRLGLPQSAFDLHIAVDIGAEGVARRLAAANDGCVITQAYSRLVIDCNRAPRHPQSIVPVSDGVVVPGNRDLAAGDALVRRRAIFDPYHARIAAELDRRVRHAVPPILVCVHSFTPSMGGVARPWHAGLLHRGDSPISHALLQVLSATSGLEIGDNQPYAMDEVDYTAPVHAIARGLDYLEIEIRQDLIADGSGEAAVGDLLAESMDRALRRIVDAAQA